MLTYSIDNNLHSRVEGSLVFTGAALHRPLRAVIGAPEPIRIISTFIIYASRYQASSFLLSWTAWKTEHCQIPYTLKQLSDLEGPLV